MALYEARTDDAHRLAQQREPSLPEAAALGAVDTCHARLDAGDNIEAPSPDGWPPLHLAAFFGHAAVVEMLLARGASVNAMATSTQGNSALHAALAGRADEATVIALLQAGADVNAPDAHQVRPIHLAASRGNVAALERLIVRGARLDAKLADETRAADLARQRGHEAAAAWLERRAAS
jgi:ankyrin repeat protein